MGVPQKRHRVFFIATRLNNVDIDKLNMSFIYNPIEFAVIKSQEGRPIESQSLNEMLKYAKKGDRNLENACFKLRGRCSFFNYCFVYDDQVAPTMTAHCNNIRWDTKSFLSKHDVVCMSTFPQDFDFLTDNIDGISYVCGMSVPPLMIKRIAERLKPYLMKET